MNPKKVLLIGGSGLVGQAVASRLSAQGVRVLVPTRRKNTTGPLSVLPKVEIVRAKLFDTDQLQSLMQGVDAVVNLVGLLHDGNLDKPYGYRFWKTHVDLVEKIVYAMRMQSVKRLIHISAIGADKEAPSAYLRSKKAGETVCEMAASHIDATIFRPSVIFGKQDAFLSVMAGFVKSLPVVPVFGANTKFQPVYVGDVADAIVASLSDSTTIGQRYDLCGPATYTMMELAEYLCKILDKQPSLVKMSEGITSLMARIMYLLPNPPLSPDNVLSLQIDYVTDGHHNYPGWNPRTMESIVPGYLLPLQPKMRLDNYRFKAGR